MVRNFRALVELAGVVFNKQGTDSLVLHFNGSFKLEDGEDGFETGLTFAPGYQGMGVLFTEEHTLYKPQQETTFDGIDHEDHPLINLGRRSFKPGLPLFILPYHQDWRRIKNGRIRS